MDAFEQVDMSRREERKKAVTNIVGLHDDGSFDRAFWQTVPPVQRLEMVWDMVLEYQEWQKPNGGQPRLQRPVCRIERRGD